MPELPEVETTIRFLNKKVLKRTFLNVWTDFQKMVKKPKNFKQFKKTLKGKKIKKIWRRGKNIIFELSQGYSLLIHQKLTGHLLVGRWKFKPSVKNYHKGEKKEIWEPLNGAALKEKVNSYIHLMFWLSGNLMLAFSDLRKFGKVELWETKNLKNSKEFKSLGPEPLKKEFTFEKFKEILKGKKGKIKQILMDQKVIAGIGNIYSDEILWLAKIHPLKDVFKLTGKNLQEIYKAIKKILPEAIRLGGESISDYRNPEGKKGNFDKLRMIYRREGERCSRCGKKIKRKKIGGRSAHFCPSCQSQ